MTEPEKPIQEYDFRTSCDISVNGRPSLSCRRPASAHFDAGAIVNTDPQQGQIGDD